MIPPGCTRPAAASCTAADTHIVVPATSDRPAGGTMCGTCRTRWTTDPAEQAAAAALTAAMEPGAPLPCRTMWLDGEPVLVVRLVDLAADAARWLGLDGDAE